MTEEERYFFDLTGYLVVKGVLSAEEVAELNAIVDSHADSIRLGETRNDWPALKGTQTRGNMGGMLFWERPDCLPFRRMLTHPTIVPYLHGVIGEGFRLDHGPGLITMDKGAEGLNLHSSTYTHYDPTHFYHFQAEKMYSGLTVVAWQLSDVNEGDGGLCVVPGSHKVNIQCPESFKNMESNLEFIKPVTCKAGDVVIFTEATTHGTLPWTASHQRRSILFKFSPAGVSVGRPPVEPDLSDFTQAQQIVMEPPYHTVNRRLLNDDGTVVPSND